MGYYDQGIEAKLANAVAISPPNLKERVQNQLADAQAQIKRYQEILELLEKNPEVERLISLLGRSGMY